MYIYIYICLCKDKTIGGATDRRTAAIQCGLSSSIGGGQNTCINQRTFMHREILHLKTCRHVIKTYESYMYLAKSYTKQCSFLKQLKLCSSRTRL